MFSIRVRTFSASSSFLNCSLELSGSRYPRAHWPSPRFCRARPERPGAPGPDVGPDLVAVGAGREAGRSADVMGGQSCVVRDARAAESMSTFSSTTGDRTPGWSELGGAPWRRCGSGRPTDHAAGAPEVHVASYHEVLGRCRTDHGDKSPGSDASLTNQGLSYRDACPDAGITIDRDLVPRRH